MRSVRSDESIATIHASLLRMRRYMSKPPGGAAELPGISGEIDFTKVAACEAVLELQATRVVTVGAIAGELTLEHSSASRLLAECEQEGLIHRARDELDGRKTVVTLTERGSQVATTAKMMHSEFLRSLLADWKSKEIAAFASLLDRFSDSVGTVLTDVTNRIDNAIVDDTRARVERLIARGGAEQPHA